MRLSLRSEDKVDIDGSGPMTKEIGLSPGLSPGEWNRTARDAPNWKKQVTVSGL